MSTKIILLIGASAVVLIFIVYAVIINNRRYSGRRRRYNKDLHSDVGDLSLSEKDSVAGEDEGTLRTLGGDGPDFTAKPEEKPAPEPQKAQEKKPEKICQDFYIVNLVKADGTPFDGYAVKTNFESHGYIFGEYDIYHCLDNVDDKSSEKFAVANLFKPGTFSKKDVNSFAVKGISFVLQPKKGSGVRNFTSMLKDVGEFAHELGAVVINQDCSRKFDDALKDQYLKELAAFDAQ